MCFGSFIQDESGALAIDSEKHGRGGASSWPTSTRRAARARVFDWNPTSNNQFLLVGRGSLIMNAISAVRTGRGPRHAVRDDLWIWPVPARAAGKARRSGSTRASTRSGSSRRTARPPRGSSPTSASTPSEATVASSFFNFPSFPGAHPREADLQGRGGGPARAEGQVLDPHDGRVEHTRNVGLPGNRERRRQEALTRFLIPRMFAQVSHGKMSAADSVRATAKEMKRIWREVASGRQDLRSARRRAWRRATPGQRHRSGPDAFALEMHGEADYAPATSQL